VRDLEYIDNFIGFRYPVVFHPVECPERILKRRIPVFRRSIWKRGL
jgi:hypothetical protein